MKMENTKEVSSEILNFLSRTGEEVGEKITCLGKIIFLVLILHFISA